jgi:hypothetical protein
MDEVILIPTHRSGTLFLDNLLSSFRGFNRYPIVVVITGFEQADEREILAVTGRFPALPISIMTTTDHFNFGALYAVYERTDHRDIFLLPNSCEIVNAELFELVFERARERSVAFALMGGLGEGGFWHSEIGKYRRPVLDRMDSLEGYLPRTALDAVKTEMTFTPRYHSLDPKTVVLFPDWVDSNHFEEKFGERRMKIANEYIIKWKGHWTIEMVAVHRAPEPAPGGDRGRGVP